MKIFYCNAKKDFCKNNKNCDDCDHFDGNGGDYREVENEHAASCDNTAARLEKLIEQATLEMDCPTAAELAEYLIAHDVIFRECEE